MSILLSELGTRPIDRSSQMFHDLRRNPHMCTGSAHA